MRLADSRVIGVFPLQHQKYKDKGWDLQLRSSIFGVRVKDRFQGPSDVGHWEIDKDSVGDIHGGQLFKKDSREIPMWRYATGVVVDPPDGPSGPGGSTGTVTRSAWGDAGYPGAGGGQVGSGAPQGGTGPTTSLQGAGAGQSRPTVVEGTTPGTDGRPGSSTQNQGQNQNGGSGDSCATMPDGMFQVRPIKNNKYEPDKRLKELKPELPKAGGKRAWPKFPKGAIGITLTSNNEEEQEDLYFPTDPRLIAVNKAGDKDMGSLVFDLNNKFEIDPDRGARLQSMMRVLKKPPGAKENALAWNIGPSGCEDTYGGYVIDRETDNPASRPKATGSGAGLSRPTVTELPVQQKGKGKVISRVSRNDGGPFDVGTGKCRHVIGQDADGHKVTRLHFDIATLFRRNDSEDGPLNVTDWLPGDELNKKVKVKFGWNAGALKWDWYTTTMVYFPPAPYSPYTPYSPTTAPTPTTYPQVPFPPYSTPVNTPGTTTPGVTTPVITGTTSNGSDPGGVIGGATAAKEITPTNPGNTGGPAGSGGGDAGSSASGGGTGKPAETGSVPPPVVSNDGRDPNDPEPDKGTQAWADWNKRRRKRREERRNDLSAPIDSQGLIADVRFGNPTNMGYGMIDAALAMGSMLAKPFDQAMSSENMANMVQPSEAASAKRAMSNPVTGQLAAFGATGGTTTVATSAPAAPPPSSALPPASAYPGPTPSPSPPTAPLVAPPQPSSVPAPTTSIPSMGDPYNYTREPGRGKYMGGTAPGGFVMMPPEVGLEFADRDYEALESMDVSETYQGVGPGVAFFAGPADLPTGRPKNCVSIKWDRTTQDMIFQAHYGASVGFDAVKIDRTNQTIAMKCRTGYWGTLDHYITAARRWTFPDINGLVMVISQQDALGGGAVPTLHSIGGGGPTVANQDSWARIKIDGTTYWIPLWR